MDCMEIKIWLLRQGVTQADIAKEIGSCRNLVWATVNGLERNGRVIQWLIAHGCPPELIVEAKVDKS